MKKFEGLISKLLVLNSDKCKLLGNLQSKQIFLILNDIISSWDLIENLERHYSGVACVFAYPFFAG